MIKYLILSTAIISLSSTITFADNESFNFKPIKSSANKSEWNPAQPWKLPSGYTQTVVSDERNLNIYDAGRNDWHDMNTVNETGPNAGRYMYRTHEIRFPGNQPVGGAISVIDLKTGETKILASDPDWNALDGIRWTAWKTLLFAEEKTNGRLFEMELNEDMMSVKAIHDRAAVGRLAHEGIDIDTQGNVYVIDEYRGRSSHCNGTSPCGGGIYKFIPSTYGDLSDGSLYVLGIKANTRRDGTGQFEWLGPIDALNARVSGTQFGGQSYQRPEDVEIIGKTLYVAITEGPRDEYGKEYYEGRVLAVDLKSMQVKNFVKAGVNVAIEIGKPGEIDYKSGFDSVDNLAEAPNGDLIMIEDNVPSDIWFASTRKVNRFGASRNVKLFASLSDPKAEGSGIYVSPQDPDTLYVNIQHSAAKDGDGTWAIRKNHRDGDDK